MSILVNKELYLVTFLFNVGVVLENEQNINFKKISLATQGKRDFFMASVLFNHV